jgi:hypothetical protein
MANPPRALPTTKVDVTIVRWLDGHRITTHRKGLQRGELLALKAEEECLPGTLASFTHVPTPRPWEPQAGDDARAL